MSLPRPSPPLPTPFAILLVPQFTMIALSSILEPPRIANRYVERPYRWTLVSMDGEPVADRNGVKVAVDGAIAAIAAAGTLIVVADEAVSQRFGRALSAQLRRLARAGMMICGVDTGPLLMARAGLLDGRVATAHWEVLATFRAQFPKVTVTAGLYEIDGPRCTCAGGSAALDLMLNDIETRFGRQLALRVSEHCMHGRLRPAIEAQRDSAQTAPGAPSRRLARAIQVLERDNAGRAAIPEVARGLGLSRRQLQRLFADELATSPGRFRARLRLEQARQMLANGEASVTEAALAAGFKSRSHFSRSYRRTFGRTPSEDRR